MENEAALIGQIRALKEEREAIILAHNYQIGPVQDIADLVGDSLELSRAAASMEGKVIVFCGVDFMAETAAILSPEKTVLLPAGELAARGQPVRGGHYTPGKTSVPRG